MVPTTLLLAFILAFPASAIVLPPGATPWPTPPCIPYGTNFTSIALASASEASLFRVAPSYVAGHSVKNTTASNDTPFETFVDACKQQCLDTGIECGSVFARRDAEGSECMLLGGRMLRTDLEMATDGVGGECRALARECAQIQIL